MKRIERTTTETTYQVSIEEVLGILVDKYPELEVMNQDCVTVLTSIGSQRVKSLTLNCIRMDPVREDVI